eukprot:Platyproteum_vivax@DN4647_c0_g1_i3.p1
MRIGMCGFGTVGGGIVKLLENHSSCEFKTIVVSNLQKKRDVEVPKGCKLSTNVEDLLSDDSLELIVEVAGGPSSERLVLESLKKGRHVVTANKPLTASKCDEINRLVQAHPSSSFGFEASVCGGIPIIGVVRHSLRADKIVRISGILNGTTNFIVSKMTKNPSLTYPEVLKEAQDLGYAEADPAADVEGYDARSKLVILARLGLGVTIKETDMVCQGLTRISQDDFKYAASIKHTIKLLGVAERKADNTVTAYISPCVVPLHSDIASIDGVTNVVQVTSHNLGDSLYVGSGAGRFPTANSVVSDILHIVENKAKAPDAQPDLPFPALDGTKFVADFEACFFIRFVVADCVGIISRTSNEMLNHGISIYAVLQNKITDHSRVPFVMVTESCKWTQVDAFITSILNQKDKEFNFLLEDPLCMPYAV